MPNLSGLKEKIQATRDIETITDAMQLVASAKLRQLGKRIGGMQTFVKEVYDAFNAIIQESDDSPYLKPKENTAKKTLWLVVNSNLGLCGGYNNNLNKLVVPKLKSGDAIYAVGQKAVTFYTHRKANIINSRVDVDINFTSLQGGEIGKQLLEYFVSGTYDEIMIAYTRFINNVTFEPTLLRLFPILKDPEVAQNPMHGRVEFLPDANTVLEKSISLYINTIVYGTIMESQISEQASRRNAMENATNNSEELINKLQLQYNRERQAAITQELTEIVNGANALKKGN